MGALVAGEDIRRLEGGVQIVSGTPGRVFDMIKRRVLQTRDIRVLVLDEADEMLSKGFKEQIYDVYRYGRTALNGLNRFCVGEYLKKPWVRVSYFVS